MRGGGRSGVRLTTVVLGRRSVLRLKIDRVWDKMISLVTKSYGNVCVSVLCATKLCLSRIKFVGTYQREQCPGVS